MLKAASGGGGGISPAQKGAAGGVAPLDANGKLPASYLPTIPAGLFPHSHTAAEVGAIATAELGVANGVATLDGSGKLTAAQLPTISLSWIQVTGKPTTFPPSAHTHVAADVGAVAVAEKGAANGVATLDASGKVPKAQLSLVALDVGAVAAAEKGTANGVATLDVSGKVPVWQMPVATSVFVPVRQTVLSGGVDANGYANFLSAGVGLTVNVSATAKAVIIAFAAGFGAAGAVDYVGSVAADASVAGLAANATNYIYADRDAGSGVVTLGRTTVAQGILGWGETPPCSLLHFDGNTACDYGSVWTAPNGYTSDAANKVFGAASALLTPASNQYISSKTPPQLSALSAWTIEGRARKSGLGTTQDLFSLTNGAGYGVLIEVGGSDNKPRMYLSSNGTSWDIASNIFGNAPALVANAWFAWAISFDGANYRFFIDGTLVATVASTLTVCPLTVAYIGYWMGAVSYWGGNVDEVRISAQCRYTSGYTLASSAFIADESWDSYIPSAGVMYQRGAIPGTKQRAYLGEVKTSGAAVSSVKTYALMGDYEGPELAMSGILNVFTHGVGMIPRQHDAVLVCRSAELGFAIGDEVNIRQAIFNVSPNNPVINTVADRNNITVITNTNGVGMYRKDTGGFATLTPANWRYKVRAKRGF